MLRTGSQTVQQSREFIRVREGIALAAAIHGLNQPSDFTIIICVNPVYTDDEAV